MKQALEEHGWFLSDEGVSIIQEQLGRPDASLDDVMAAALDMDLRQIGQPQDRKGATTIPSPLVLQVQEVRNVALPSTHQVEHPRLLRVVFTEGGKKKLTGVEFLGPVDSIKLLTPPGSKFLLTKPATIQDQLLLLGPGMLKPLGGNVQEMVQAWRAGKQFVKRGLQTDDNSGPPPFVPFKIQPVSKEDKKKLSDGINKNKRGKNSKEQDQKGEKKPKKKDGEGSSRRQDSKKGEKKDHGEITDTKNSKSKQDKPKPSKADKPTSDNPKSDKGDKQKSDGRGIKPKSDKQKSDKSDKTDKPKSDKPKPDKPKSDKPKSEKPKPDKSKADKPNKKETDGDMPPKKGKSSQQKDGEIKTKKRDKPKPNERRNPKATEDEKSSYVGQPVEPPTTHVESHEGSRSRGRGRGRGRGGRGRGGRGRGRGQGQDADVENGGL